MLQHFREFLGRLPLVGSVAVSAWNRGAHSASRLRRFGFDSADYWSERYAEGGNSGAGSYGRLARFKAEFLNRFVEEHQVTRVVEFGVGDGNQLGLARYPEYTGLDIATSAVERCQERFRDDPTKRFVHYKPSDLRVSDVTAELALSLDVVFHLVEQRVFETYMRHLFDAATRYVIVYADDQDENPPWCPPHIRHRRFTPWVANHAPEWEIVDKIANPFPFEGDFRNQSYSEFHVFARR